MKRLLKKSVILEFNVLHQRGRAKRFLSTMQKMSLECVCELDMIISNMEKAKEITKNQWKDLHRKQKVLKTHLKISKLDEYKKRNEIILYIPVIF